MSEHLQIWLFGGGAAAIVSLYGLWLWHTRDCEIKRIKHAEDIKGLQDDRNRLFDEVGTTHETGLRGRVHKLENILSPSFLRWQADQERKGS